MALLPDPGPRERQHVLISVDDHVIEPPDMFDGRLPAALAGRAPRIVETDDGRQVWRYEDRDYPNLGLTRVIGHQGPDRRHGPGRDLGVAEFPVADRGICRDRVLEERRSGVGARRAAGLER